MTITQRVENILKVSHQARNSDTELLIIYMQKAGMELTPRQVEVFKKLPSMETIRRIRQKLQEQGKYRADQSVETARYNKFKVMRGSAGVTTAQEAERILESQGYKVRDWGE